MKSFKQFQEALIAKGAGKLDSEVLKQNPDLDPTKPRDYMKLKRMQKKLTPKVDLALNTEEAIAAPTNNASSGAIAGLPPDDPPVRKNKRGSGMKNRKKKTYAYGGYGSRKNWMV